MKTEQIAVDRLHPNDWNPNRMTDEQSAELIAEVRHLQGLPKPVVVRQNEDGYQIVDGEHGWRAAKEVGLDTIPCEVIEADDFESMRQTYKRNQHGKHAPVLQGRLFRRMMREQKLSVRKLATEIGVSEGTVRNSCLYVEAVEVRSRYAPDRDPSDIEAEISELPVTGVRYYLGLPAIVRNHWLNLGGDLDYFERIGFDPDEFEKELAEIEESGIAESLEPKRRRLTRTFLKKLAKLANVLQEWPDRGRVFFDRAGGFHAFLKPLIENALPYSVIGELRLIGEDGQDDEKIAIPADRWQQLIANIVEQVPDRNDYTKFLDLAMHAYYKEVGILIDNDKHPVNQYMHAELKDAPDYIKSSELSLGDKAWVHTLEGIDKEKLAGLLTEDEIDQLKRETVKRLEFRDETIAGTSPICKAAAKMSGERLEDMQKYAMALTAKDAFVGLTNDCIREKQLKQRNELFDDRGRLEAMLFERQRQYHTMREGTVNGRPAMDVFAERIKAMEWPELRLLCAYMLDDAVRNAAAAAESLWLQAVGGKQPGEDSEEGA